LARPARKLSLQRFFRKVAVEYAYTQIEEQKKDLYFRFGFMAIGKNPYLTMNFATKRHCFPCAGVRVAENGHLVKASSQLLECGKFLRWPEAEVEYPRQNIFVFRCAVCAARVKAGLIG